MVVSQLMLASRPKGTELPAGWITKKEPKLKLSYFYNSNKVVLLKLHSLCDTGNLLVHLLPVARCLCHNVFLPIHSPSIAHMGLCLSRSCVIWWADSARVPLGVPERQATSLRHHLLDDDQEQRHQAPQVVRRVLVRAPEQGRGG